MSNNRYDANVIIVGGAVAGASLACALARYNLKVLLFDRRKDPGSMNRGDGLQPRTLEILERWGALPDLVKYPNLKSYGIELHHPVLKQLMKIDLKPISGSKYNYILNIPHRYIEQGLLDYAAKHEQVVIQRGVLVDRVIFDDQQQACGVVVRQGGNETVYQAPVIIAADGGLSTIRGQLGIRADRQVYNHELVVLHMVRPDWYAGDLRTQVHLHRDGAVVLIPLPDQQMRITIVVSSGEASKWRKMTDEQLVAELTKRVPKLQSVPIQREGEHIYKMVRMHAEQYSRQGIALIGDAAHLTHASSGQGMNMAIQDADLLSELLYRYFAGSISLEKAYEIYEQIRKPINEDIISRSNFMSTVVYTPSPIAHTMKMLGMFSTRLIPGLRSKIGGKIARGISGIEQNEVIDRSLSALIEPM